VHARISADFFKPICSTGSKRQILSTGACPPDWKSAGLPVIAMTAPLLAMTVPSSIPVSPQML
jgi:hypothetical protein